MTREDDVKKEMARIKASNRYQDYQEKHAPKIATEKALAKLEPWKLGTTLDGKHEVWAPVAGPDAAKVLHFKRRVWMCSHCRCTFQFRKTMMIRQVAHNEDGTISISDHHFRPKAIVVDFDGKVYHHNCYHEMKRVGDELAAEKREDEIDG